MTYVSKMNRDGKKNHLKSTKNTNVDYKYKIYVKKYVSDAKS